MLGIKPEERRLSLGLKQTLADPWSEVAAKFPVGSQVEGPVTKLMKFGAFVQIAEGIEGLVHVSEITAERRIDHPQDVCSMPGQVVQAQVLAIDTEKAADQAQYEAVDPHQHRRVHRRAQAGRPRLGPRG